MKFEVKIRTGTRSHKRLKMAKTISSDNNTAGITSLVLGVKNLRLRNGLEFDRAY